MHQPHSDIPHSSLAPVLSRFKSLHTHLYKAPCILHKTKNKWIKRNCCKNRENAILKNPISVLPPPWGNRQWDRCMSPYADTCSGAAIKKSSCWEVCLWAGHSKPHASMSSVGLNGRNSHFRPEKKKTLHTATGCLQSTSPLQTRGKRNTRRLRLWCSMSLMRKRNRINKLRLWEAHFQCSLKEWTNQQGAAPAARGNHLLSAAS